MHPSRPPIPPFTRETAIIKVRSAEDGWNSRDPARVALAYTEDSSWRNRAEFVRGRPEIVAFLTRKWHRELDYRLIKELWSFDGNRIAVRFTYESHDDSGNWYRSFGNENWEFDEYGLMSTRYASINDLPILESDRKFHWDARLARPADHPGLSSSAFRNSTSLRPYRRSVRECTRFAFAHTGRRRVLANPTRNPDWRAARIGVWFGPQRFARLPY